MSQTPFFRFSLWWQITKKTEKSGLARRRGPLYIMKRTINRGSGSSRSEESNFEHTQQRLLIQLQQPHQQQRPVTSLPVVNPASISSRRPVDSWDQIAPTSPKRSRKVTIASRHVSEHMSQPMDHDQVSNLPEGDLKLTNTDFICPICFEVLKEPFITRCGHIYCYDCITMTIKNFGRCPMCNEVLNEDNLIPCAQFGEVIYKFCKQQEAEKRKLPTKAEEEVLEQMKSFTRNSKAYLYTRLGHMMKTDEEQRMMTELDNQISFLTNLKKHKEDKMESYQKQIKMICDDLETSKLKKDQLMEKKTVLGAELSSSQVVLLLTSDEMPGPSGLQQLAVLCRML